MLFERMAKLEAALELAYVVHECLGTCATCTLCTLFEGRALTELLRASSASTRHWRAPTSGWKCRLRVRLRRSLTRSRGSSDEENEGDESRDERLVRCKELRRRAHVEMERACCCLFGEDVCDLFIWYSRCYALNVPSGIRSQVKF